MWFFRSNSNSNTSSPKKGEDDDDDVKLKVIMTKNEMMRRWKEFSISKTSMSKNRFSESFKIANRDDVSSMVKSSVDEKDLLVHTLLDMLETESDKVSNVFLALSDFSSGIWNEKRLSRLLRLLRESKSVDRKRDILGLLISLSSDEDIKTRMAGLEEIQYIAEILEVKDESLRSNSLKSLRKLLKIHELNEEERELQERKKKEHENDGQFRGFAPWLGKWLNARSHTSQQQKRKVNRSGKRPFPPPRQVLDAYQKRLKQAEEEEESYSSMYKNQTISAMIAVLTHGTQKDFLGAIRAVCLFFFFYTHTHTYTHTRLRYEMNVLWEENKLNLYLNHLKDMKSCINVRSNSYFQTQTATMIRTKRQHRDFCIASLT